MEFLIKSWYNVIWLIFFLSSSSFLQASYGYDPESLSAFFHDYANTSVRYPHTGKLYNLSLPANFSGMEASFLRIRSAKFWLGGVNFSSVYIPPLVVPMPYVKRIAIVYENLGNWSSVYYKVSNYRLVAPVIGFLAYDSSSSAVGTQKINFLTQGDSIVIQFPHIDVQEGEIPKCVEFGPDGSFWIKNMTGANECHTHGEGHFSLVVPSPITPTPTPTPTPRATRKNSEKWRKGLIAGIFGLILLGLVMIGMYKLVRRRQLRAMEKQSEKGVAFDTFWVGRSKMPSAAMTRTQPYLEQAEYAP